MKLYYRIYKETLANGQEEWYVDRYMPFEWSWNIGWVVLQCFMLFELGWQPMRTWMEGSARPIGNNEKEARDFVATHAQGISDARVEARKYKVVGRSGYTDITVEVE